jgi:hypothetical protein
MVIVSAGSNEFTHESVMTHVIGKVPAVVGVPCSGPAGVGVTPNPRTIDFHTTATGEVPRVKNVANKGRRRRPMESTAPLPRRIHREISRDQNYQSFYVNSPIVPICIGEYALPLGDDRAECAEASGSRNRDARGAITGILPGASVWAAILACVGVITL